MIGLRREDKNEWERRAPLTPDHVAELVDVQSLDITIQASALRAFPDVDYRKAGARLDEDLSGCRVILGIKEIPVEKLLPRTTYLFFSHTTKAQDYNMPMLRRLLELGCTLIDYEQILDAGGRRLIFFGRHAGYAGMIDALWALGRRLRAEGRTTPLERVRLAHDYASLDEATHHISRIGEELRHTGIPDVMRPIVCGFTGSGNVTQGALEIYERLPTLALPPDELAELEHDTHRPRNVVYAVRFRRNDRYVRSDGGPVDLEEFARHPDRYRSGLRHWLRHLTMLIHGAYWKPPQPRLVTRADLRELWGRSRPKLRVIADISCDIDGAIESTVRATTPGDPVYLYDVERGEEVAGLTGEGPLMMTVDNLPCQLPAESSQHFGDTLIRFVPLLARCDWTRPLEALELPPAISRAIIVHRGRLTPPFAYLRPHVGRASGTTGETEDGNAPC